jgi:elongation of very long chain fatty acids protein 4
MHFYIESYVPTLIAQVFYISIVLLAWTRPNMFPKRAKTKAITFVMQLHNFILVVWSTSMWTGVMYQIITNKYKFVGNSFNPEHVGLAFWIHQFDISKIYEFMDTFIMIYRGNLRQVSFLHAYHHLYASALGWYTSRVGPGGDAWHAVVINSFIHMVMYTYYFLSTIIEDPQLRKKYLSWGKYLTQMQMAQFVMLTSIHTASVLLNKGYAWEIPGANLLFCMTLFGLFAQFYVQKWTEDKSKAKQKNAAKVE